MTKLQRLRTRAFLAQGGLCFYCGIPMWLHSPTELGIKPRTARPLRCTAEHVVPRQDGGRDTQENIVAACLHCNLRRHKRKTPPPADVFRALVHRRLARGKWWPATIADELPSGLAYAKELG